MRKSSGFTWPAFTGTFARADKTGRAVVLDNLSMVWFVALDDKSEDS